jgi:hypothetical protein
MTDVIMYVLRSASDEAESRGRRRSASQSGRTAYTVLVYSTLSFELPRELPYDLARATEKSLAGLPLAGVARLEVGWSRYEDYLAAFLQGEKAPDAMRKQLGHTLAPALTAAVRLLGDRAARLWFYTECVELDELPWELLLGDPGGEWEERVCVVRGLPTQTRRATVPLSGKPRLGIIGAPPFVHPSLWKRLHELQNIEVIALHGDPRECLQQAVANGFELLHVVADGFVTQAYEGTLYFHGLPENMRRELAGAELASHLLSSRIAVLGLSVPDERAVNNPDVIQVAGREVPSAYRAYVRMAASEKSLPTVVAPLGPFDEPMAQEAPRLADFWGTFYEEIGASCSVQTAVAHGRSAVRGAAVALHLRHEGVRVFRRATAPELLADIPQKAAEYALSMRFTDRIRMLQQELGTSSNAFATFLEEEGAHQKRIETELAPWTRDEETGP